MSNKILKTLILSFIITFSIAFINIDRVEAASACSADSSQYEEAFQCTYSESFILSFAKSKSGDYCYVGNQLLVTYTTPLSWIADIFTDGNTSTRFNAKPIATYNISDNKIKDAFDNNSCPELAFTVYMNFFKTELEEFKVADECVCGIDGCEPFPTAHCFTTQGENRNTIDVSHIYDNIEDIDSIVRWGTEDPNVTKSRGYSYSSSGCDLIDEKIIKFLDNLFLVISIIGIILLVVMSAIEFVKALTGSDEDGLKGAIKHTFIRIVCIIILLLLPTFINWLLNIVNENNYVYVSVSDGNEDIWVVTKEKHNGTKVKIKIGENGDPICKIGS